MPTINTVTVSGRLTRDAKKATTGNGTDLLDFSLAVTKRIKRGDDWLDFPMYIDVTAWDAYTVKCQQSLVKGVEVVVSGELDYSTWETQGGEKRSKVSIKSHQVVIGREPKGTNGNQQQSSIYDEDVPF